MDLSSTEFVEATKKKKRILQKWTGNLEKQKQI